ncbi:hypothetical protein NL676_023631 [Syzygium grande]|nr:hypothetical protein NL676_023631 [Syzygium grande]
MFPVVARSVAPPPPPPSSASTAFGFRRFHLTGMRRPARFSSSGRLPKAPDSSGPEPGEEAPGGPSLPPVRVFTRRKKKKRLIEAVPVEQKQPKVEPLLSRKPCELPDIEEFAYKNPNGSALSGLLKRNSDVIVLLNGVVSQVKPRVAPPPN